MKKAGLLPIYLSLIIPQVSNAQLSPPGMGETETAFWSAIGIKQHLNEKNTSLTYVGFGRISGDSNDALNLPSIFVANEEVYHRFAKNWKYSAALSYRRQYEYEGGVDQEVSAIKQEFRTYGRLQYTTTVGRTKWAATLRQEIRKFYTGDFQDVPDGLQLRTRFKTQISLPLDLFGTNSISGSAEALFSAARDQRNGWGNFDYKESRFCLYYTLSPKSLPATFDVGYMYDLVGYGGDMYDAHYFAMDIVLKDPF